MNYSTIRRTAVAGLAVVLLTSACADDAGSSTDGDDTKLTQETMPLQVYLADIIDDDDDTMIAEQTATEELVAQCMADQGFEYLVPDVAGRQSAMSSDSEEDWNSKEWISKNGYGMSGIEEESGDEEDVWDDPNSAYYDSLSEASRVAWDTALWGSWETPEGLTEDEQMEWSPPLEEQGCYGKAQSEAPGAALWEDPEFKAISEAMTAVYEDLAKSPEIVEADGAWSECMADAGYPGMKSQSDAMTSISDAQSALWEGLGDDPDAEPDAEATAELRTREIATALADFTCKEEVGYDTTALEAQFAAEEQFIADHKSELDALLDAYATK